MEPRSSSRHGGECVVVVGGAGYIGSHMCESLSRDGYDVVVVDNLSTGHRRAVRWGELIVADLADADVLGRLFSSRRVAAVMHFAARIVVNESVADPAAYYANNVCGTLDLLDAMRRNGAPPLVFSSTAAVYGDPQYSPLDEAHPCKPVNPYGRTKLQVEQMLADFRAAYGLRSVALRYFNAAGASDSGCIGEMHDPETHLIPVVLRACEAGRAVPVYGDDYDTPDGTCVRDYVHVTDLCEAHLAALKHLTGGGDNEVLNLGTGRGHSVREVIDTVERTVGRPARTEINGRRAGDPSILVADPTRAGKVLGWTARRGLAQIVASAWRWEQARAACTEGASLQPSDG